MIDYIRINNHRYRQRTFINSCIQHIYNKYVDIVAPKTKYKHVYMAHIDTDEYIVINQHLLDRKMANEGTSGGGGGGGEVQSMVSSRATRGSILEFYAKMRQDYSKRLHPICQSMPTVLYGSIEETEEAAASESLTTTSEVNLKSFESIRWHYHASWRDYRNGFQKVLMDLALYVNHQNDPVFTSPFAYNPHQPSNQTCSRMTLFPEISAIRKYPLTINHYIGSYERYISRQGDLRRNRGAYEKKSNLSDIKDSNGWINTWLDNFIHEYGIDTAKVLLGERYFT